MKTLLLALVTGAPALSIGQPLPPVPDSPASITDYEYDAEGRMTRVVRGSGTLDLSMQLGRDRLGRVETITDPAQGTTRLRHDTAGRPLQVIDPRNLATRYERDGWGRIAKIISPDGGTAEFHYDSAHNLAKLLDNRGVTGRFEHDWQHRPTSARYSSASATDEALRWTYDESGPLAGFGHGNLTSTSFPAGSTRYLYGEGRELEKTTQRIEPAAGAHSAALIHVTEFGYVQTRLTRLTYPSGRQLHVTWNAGRIEAMGLAAQAGAQPKTLISQVTWEPFGAAVRGWSWETANGPIRHESTRDLAGRLVRYPLGDVIRDLRYDEADRIVSFTHLARDASARPMLDQQFSFDANDRLAGVVSATASWRIEHDANGNRTLLSLNGNSNTYGVDPASNRLLSVGNPEVRLAHDAAGNLTELISGGQAFVVGHNLAGQVTTLSRHGVTTSYAYDALGQRIRKSDNRTVEHTTVFVYDPDGHLLGEYDHTGKVLREYVWLNDTPVAVFMPDPADPTGAPEVFYIHADHIDTPRVVVDVHNRVRWRWWSEPFGTTAPETNPQGLGSFTFNLRFPGQYADAESGLFYNGFRYYSPQGGQYTQSDSIGLMGGSLSTYSYANGNPVSFVDPDGLFAWGIVFGGADLAWQLYQNGGRWKCVNWMDVGLSMTGGGLLNGLLKGAGKIKTGSKLYGANWRRWYRRNIEDYDGNTHNAHHWLLERNQGLGRHMPDAVKNQPWNVNVIGAQFNNWLSRHPTLAPLGGPLWAGELAGGLATTAVGSDLGDDCECR